ncbi:MAG: IclR family transcriptional regulator [Actinobacteria bacterium]|nr:IclR family transcriptional regulator [Actinomycetota bacterium]
MGSRDGRGADVSRGDASLGVSGPRAGSAAPAAEPAGAAGDDPGPGEDHAPDSAAPPRSATAPPPAANGSAAGPAGGGSPPEAAPDYGQKVPAVDQAIKVLHFLAGDPRGQSTLTEICSGVGIYKSKGKAILNTLRSANLVTKNDHDKTYALGSGLLLLSRALLDQSDLTRAAAPFLEELAVVPGTLAFMTLIRDSQQYVVARSGSPGGISVSIRVGYHYPLTWGSMGKAIVAFLPEAEREELLAAPPLFFHGDPRSDPEDLDAVRAELELCRRSGFGADLGAITPGLMAVSAPLVGGRGAVRPVGTVSVAGTFPRADAEEHGRRVAAKAREMRVRLGPLLDDVG